MVQIDIPSKPKFTRPIDVVFLGYSDQGVDKYEPFRDKGLFTIDPRSTRQKLAEWDSNGEDGEGYIDLGEMYRETDFKAFDPQLLQRLARVKRNGEKERHYWNAFMRYVTTFFVAEHNIRTVAVNRSNGTGSLALSWAHKRGIKSAMLPEDPNVPKADRINKNLEELFSERTLQLPKQNGVNNEMVTAKSRPMLACVFPPKGPGNGHSSFEWLQRYNKSMATLNYGPVTVVIPPDWETLRQVVAAIRIYEAQKRREADAGDVRPNKKVAAKASGRAERIKKTTPPPAKDYVDHKSTTNYSVHLSEAAKELLEKCQQRQHQASKLASWNAGDGLSAIENRMYEKDPLPRVSAHDEDQACVQMELVKQALKKREQAKAEAKAKKEAAKKAKPKVKGNRSLASVEIAM